MAKFAKLVWLAAVQLFYICRSFSYYPNKKREREREKRKVQKQFLKRNDQNQCMLLCCPWNSIVVVLDQTGTKGILASWCCRSAPSQAFILHACCLLQQTKSHNTHSIAQAPICDEAKLLPVLLPTIRWTKRDKCADYELQKAQRAHKDVFPVTLSFMQKSDLQTGHLSGDRSFAWNLQQ